MLQRCAVFLMAAAALLPLGAQPSLLRQWSERPSASGTFVQRKTLADVEVTITSKGTFRFEKDRMLEWRTSSPLESVFSATPESCTTTANGKSSTRKLSDLKMSDSLRTLVKGELSALTDAFEMTERRGADGVSTVFTFTPKEKNVQAFVRRFTIEGAAFPRHFTLDYTNGDRLDIELVETR